MQEPMFSYMTSMHYMVYIVKGTVAGERLLPYLCPAPCPAHSTRNIARSPRQRWRTNFYKVGEVLVHHFVEECNIFMELKFRDGKLLQDIQHVDICHRL